MRHSKSKANRLYPFQTLQQNVMEFCYQHQLHSNLHRTKLTLKEFCFSLAADYKSRNEVAYVLYDLSYAPSLDLCLLKQP